MKKWFALAFILVLGISACAQASASTEPAVPTNTPMPPTEVPPTVAPSPTPEPAGPRVAFISNRDCAKDAHCLHVLDVESGEITFIDTGFDQVAFPRWSPDGSKILFAVKDVWNLYTIDADGSNLTQVTDFRSNSADWSPDGNRIVFQSDHNGEPENKPDIYTMDITGENLVKIVENLPVPDFNPRWAKDSNEIMFLSARTGNLEVFLMNPDGTDVKQVTEGGSPIINASISPDGSRIAFVYPQGGKFTDLYTIDKNGDTNSVIRLTKDATLDDAPAWSPDGSKIVFHSNRADKDVFDIWMINADGSNPVQLTNDEYYNAYPDYWAP